MASNQGDGTNPRVATTLPSNRKTALDYVATERSKPGNRTYTADILREAIDEYLKNHLSELPPEARDLLDEDLLANAGGTEEVEA